MSFSKNKKRSESCEYEGPHDFSGHFDVLKLNEHLRLCLQPKKDKTNENGNCGEGDETSSEVEVILEEYIQIFHQLYKFFCMLGTVFGFVGSDIKGKVEVLSEYRNGANGDEYETVAKMLEFEKDTGHIKNNKHENGSRTFLRLHRALVFVSQFLRKSVALGDHEGTSHICKEAYNETLAKYHPWLVQKGAILAMYTLPNKKDLFKQFSGDRHFEEGEVLKLLTEAIDSTQKIYDECQKLYAKYDLLSLP